MSLARHHPLTNTVRRQRIASHFFLKIPRQVCLFFNSYFSASACCWSARVYLGWRPPSPPPHACAQHANSGLVGPTRNVSGSCGEASCRRLFDINQRPSARPSNPVPTQTGSSTARHSPRPVQPSREATPHPPPAPSLSPSSI